MTLLAGYIVPHPPLAVEEIGRNEEKEIESTLSAFRDVAKRIAHHKPDTLIFVSPHTAYYQDWIYVAAGKEATGSFVHYGAPQVSFELVYDEALREKIIAEAKGSNLAAGMIEDRVQELDHGVMVPLYFINQQLAPDSYQAVSIGGSGLPSEKLLDFGRALARAAEKEAKRIVLVISGDLSHKLKEDGPYGFSPYGPVFDREFKAIVETGNLLEFADMDPVVREQSAECGLSGFIMLAGALDEVEKETDTDISSELLSLEGPFGVGYGVAAFEAAD